MTSWTGRFACHVIHPGTDRGCTAELCNWRCWEETSERKRERVGRGGSETENKGRVGGKGLRLSWKLGGISADSFSLSQSRPPLSQSLYGSPPCYLAASPPFIHSTFLVVVFHCSNLKKSHKDVSLDSGERHP